MSDEIVARRKALVDEEGQHEQRDEAHRGEHVVEKGVGAVHGERAGGHQRPTDHRLAVVVLDGIWRQLHALATGVIDERQRLGQRGEVLLGRLQARRQSVAGHPLAVNG